MHKFVNKTHIRDRGISFSFLFSGISDIFIYAEEFQKNNENSSLTYNVERIIGLLPNILK